MLTVMMMTRWDPQVEFSSSIYQIITLTKSKSSFTGSCFEASTSLLLRLTSTCPGYDYYQGMVNDDRSAVFCVCECICVCECVFVRKKLQGISKGQLLFRKALRKSGKSPVDFPGFLMAFLLIPYIVIFWAKFKPFLSYLIEYSRSLRTCSPLYHMIQYLIEYSSNLLDLLSFPYHCIILRGTNDTLVLSLVLWWQHKSIISRVQQKLEDLLSSIPDYSIPYRIQQ